MYFSSPLENIFALWYYFKIILFNITNKTNLTLPYLNNVISSSLTLLEPPMATFSPKTFSIWSYKLWC